MKVRLELSRGAYLPFKKRCTTPRTFELKAVRGKVEEAGRKLAEGPRGRRSGASCFLVSPAHGRHITCTGNTCNAPEGCQHGTHTNPRGKGEKERNENGLQPACARAASRLRLQSGSRRPAAAAAGRACFSPPSTPRSRLRTASASSMRRPSISATPSTYDRTTPRPTQNWVS